METYTGVLVAGTPVDLKLQQPMQRRNGTLCYIMHIAEFQYVHDKQAELRNFHRKENEKVFDNIHHRILLRTWATRPIKQAIPQIDICRSSK